MQFIFLHTFVGLSQFQQHSGYTKHVNISEFLLNFPWVWVAFLMFLANFCCCLRPYSSAVLCKFYRLSAFYHPVFNRSWSLSLSFSLFGVVGVAPNPNADERLWKILSRELGCVCVCIFSYILFWQQLVKSHKGEKSLILAIGSLCI